MKYISLILLLLTANACIAKRTKVVVISDNINTICIFNKQLIESKSTNNNKFKYIYYKDTLIKIMQFQKNNGTYTKNPTDSGIYADVVNGHVSSHVQYSENFDKFAIPCKSDFPYLNHFNLLDYNFCFYGSILYNQISNYGEKFKHNGLINQTVDIKIASDIVQVQIPAFSPFLEGTNITRLVFHEQNNLLMEVDGYLFDARNNNKKILYKRLYKYDKLNRLVEAKTTSNLSKIPENITLYKYYNL